MITGLIIALLIINVFLVALLGMIWAERRLIARFQGRTGPNRWGPFGILTPIADAVKIMFKEDVQPFDADKWLYNLAPLIILVPILLVWAFIPIGNGTFAADINVGLVFILGISSLNALAIIVGALGSGNRIAVFSALRAVAILISYEIPAALALIGIVMISGSLSLGSIVASQSIPFLLVQPLGFLVFFIATLAELNRTPFDLTEAESELASGHLNDYSSMKFGVMFVAEYAATLTAAALIVTLFLSGWRGWGFIPSQIWFVLKVALVLVAIVWVRVSWPRLRIDQVLELAWKGLFELTLVSIVVTAVMLWIFPSPTTGQLWIIAAVNWAFFFPAIWMISRVLRKDTTKIAEEGAFYSDSESQIAPYPVAPHKSERTTS